MMHRSYDTNSASVKAKQSKQTVFTEFSEFAHWHGWARLVELPRWIVWRAERKNPDDPNERPRKVPYGSHTGKRIDATDPRNGGTLAQALLRMRDMGINSRVGEG